MPQMFQMSEKALVRLRGFYGENVKAQQVVQAAQASAAQAQRDYDLTRLAILDALSLESSNPAIRLNLDTGEIEVPDPEPVPENA